MPTRAKHPCNRPGCVTLTTARYCEACQLKNPRIEQRRQFDRLRSSDPFRALYKTVRWIRLRLHILARDPICKIAIVCVRKHSVAIGSSEVDHIRPVRAGGDFWDENNLQGACHDCHSRKTALEDSQFTTSHQEN